MKILDLAASKDSLPTNKTEHYKYFALKPSLEKDYQLNQISQASITNSDNIEILDGVVTKAPDFVSTTNRAEQLNHFDSMYQFNYDNAQNIIVVNIEKSLSKPLNIIHKITKDNSLNIYRVIVNIKENEQAVVYETIKMDETKNSGLIYGYDFNLSDYANLEIIRNQTLVDDNLNIGVHTINLKKNANCSLKTYDFGHGKATHNYNILLDDYATINTYHLLYANKEAKCGNVFHLNHNGKHSKSTQEAKYILNNKATGIFDGRIIINHDAKHSSANQNSKAMILDHDSGVKMAAKPQLEIYTDELEASHGSSTGQLDKKQMFYLRSRGLSQSEAKKILILAFANDLIQKISDETIIEDIQSSFNTLYKG